MISLRWLIFIIVTSIMFLFTSIVVIVWNWKSIKNRFKVWFQRKNYFKVYFHHPNGQTEWQPKSLDDNNQFTHKGCAYDFDQDCVRYEKNIPIISYYHNIPNPINYRKHDSKNIDVIIDGKTYKEVMEAKIIKNLLSDQKQFFIMIILLAAIGLIVLVLAAYEMGFLDQFIHKPAGK